MTVLQLVTQREPAGAQRVAHRLDQGFRDRGIEGDVAFLYRKADAFEDEGYQDLAPKRPGPLGLVVLAVRLFRLLRSTRPDAVIAHGFHATVYTAVVASLARVPTRIAVHHVLAEFEGPARCRVLSLVRRTPAIDTHVYVSETTLTSFGPGARRRSVVIHNGVDVPERRADHGWERDPRTDTDRAMLLAVGRLVAQKDQRCAVEALRHLPDVELVVLGEGDLRAELSDLAVALGVGDRVHLVGNIAPAEVADAMTAADVVVQPSVWEAFSMVILEAMALGVPLVVSDIAAHREALGGAAQFHPVGDAAALAGAVEAVLEDPTRRRTLADAARRQATRYSQAAVTDRYAALVRAGTDPTPSEVR